MKRTIHTTHYAIFLTISFFTLTTSAQSFQWAKRGGSTNTLQRSQDYNNVIDMVTDEADNVYLLCYTGASSLQVDGHPLQAYSAIGIGDSKDIVLTSFTEGGRYRWSKVIGYGGNDYGIGLKVHKDFVYLSGNTRATGDSAFFDGDTVYHQVYNGYQSKQAFLVQYDTSGVFQWLRMPGAEDTIPIGGTSEYGYWLDVATNGDVYWFCDLVPGCLPNTSQPVSQAGTYVLRYTQHGQFLNRTQLNVTHYGQFLFNGAYNEGNFIRNHQTGEYFLGGTTGTSGSLLIGNDTIKGSMYLAVFDSTGQVLWKKESDPTQNFSGLNDFKLDSQGSIYVTGSSWDGANVFNNYHFTSPKLGARPFIMKLNSDGTTAWAKLSAGFAGSIGNKLVLNSQEVCIAGYHGGLYWQGPNDLDTLKAVPNQGYDAFIARFDTQTGDLLGMESAKTPFGAASYGYSITADSEGSYYLGGNFDQQLYMGPDTLYKIGSQRSFFVAKYACGIPAASFTVSNDTVGYYFTYTGTPADSVVWDFGDGSAPYKGDSVSHVYSAKGQYIVCATAYDGCGDTTRCDTVDVQSIGIEDTEALQFIIIYPNPVNELLYISCAEDEVYDVTLSDISGHKVMDRKNSTSLDMSQLPAGTYFLRIERGDYSVVRKVVVQ